MTPASAPRRSRRLRAGLVGLTVALALSTVARPGPALAHALAPALLEVIETAPNRFEVHFKTSRLRPRGARIDPELPPHCRDLGESRFVEDAASVTVVYEVDCGEAELVGERIAVRGLESAGIDVLVRLAFADDRVVSEILGARRPDFRVPERPSALDVVASYLGLGALHILTGFDHLAFVLGLLILVRRMRPLVQTITAFTLGHSITLSLVALGIARVPSAPIEILIAMSVLVLALEAVRPPDAPRDGLARRPWLMAAGFGLLHGMGFAGALAEVGLPDDEIPLALFAFNVGIEIGQIVFVLAVVGLRWALSGPISRTPSWAARLPAYAIGSLAVYWCLQRTAGLL